MPLFTNELLKSFRATLGAFSEVTAREATGDKSVTLDLDEKNIIYSVYRSSSFERKGGAITNNNSSYKMFYVHGGKGNNISKIPLAVVYPKSEGNELRLYFKSGQFDPDEGDYWFIFTRDGEDCPHIGWMMQNDWNRLLVDSKKEELGIQFNSFQKIDDEDEE